MSDRRPICFNRLYQIEDKNLFSVEIFIYWTFDYFFYNAAKRPLRGRFAAYLVLAPILLKRWQR